MKVSKDIAKKKLVIFTVVLVALLFMMEPLGGNIGNSSSGLAQSAIAAPAPSSVSQVNAQAHAASPTGSTLGTYTLGQIGNPDYVNSYEASTVCDFFILGLIYNSATTELSNGTYYYCLATGFNVTTAPKGMTTFNPVTGANSTVAEIYTVHIRPGVQWDDYNSTNAKNTYTYSNHVSFNNASGVPFAHTYTRVYNATSGKYQSQKPITMRSEYVQAADFILSWEMMQSSADYSGSYAGVVNVVPINNLTVEYYLNIPSATFVPYTLETPILPYHIWAPHDYATKGSGIWNETASSTLSPLNAYNAWDMGHVGTFGAGNGEFPDLVGTGPFMMNGGYGMPKGKVFTNDYWQVYANPNYFLKNVKGNDGFAGTNCTDVSQYSPHIYSIKTSIYSGPSPAVAALKANKIDAIESSLSSSFVQTAIGISGVHVISKPSTGYAYFKFNSFKADAPYNITAFRQALRYASPLGYVQTSICDGDITSGYSIIPQINQAYYNSAVPTYSYNPTLANSTIAKIPGMVYKSGEWYYNGKQVTATIQSPSSSLIPQIFTGYEAIAQDWSKIGIATTIKSESFATEIGYFDAYGPSAASPSASYNVITLGVSGLLGDPVGDLITDFNYSQSIGTGNYEGPFSSLDITPSTAVYNTLFNVSTGMKTGKQIDSLMINLTQFANTNSSIRDTKLAIDFMQYIEDVESTMMVIGYGPVDHLAINNNTFTGITNIKGDIDQFWYYNEMSVHLRTVSITPTKVTSHAVVTAMPNGTSFINGQYGKVTFKAVDNATGNPIAGASVTVGENPSLLPMVKESNGTLVVNDTGLKGITNSSGIFVYYFKVTRLNTAINVPGYSGGVNISAIVVPSNTAIGSAFGSTYINDYPVPVMYKLENPGVLVDNGKYKYFNLTVYNALTDKPISGYAYTLQAMQAAMNVKTTNSHQSVSVRSTYSTVCGPYTEMSVGVNKTYADPNVVSISGVSASTGMISILVSANSTFNYTLNGNNYETYIFIGDYALDAPVFGIAPYVDLGEVTSQYNPQGYGSGQPIEIPVELEKVANNYNITVKQINHNGNTELIYTVMNGTSPVANYNLSVTTQNAEGANRGYFIDSNKSAVNPNAALLTTFGPGLGSAYLPMINLTTNSHGVAYANFTSMFYNDTNGIITPQANPTGLNLPYDEFEISAKGDGAIALVDTTVTSIKYNVTVTETGLPTGTTWYVNLTNGASYSSKTSTLTFRAINGTYDYTVATMNKDYAPVTPASSFTVNGKPVSASVTFKAVTYTVTVTETGLKSGDKWSVTLNGKTESSTTTTIKFTEMNGTYTYTIGSVKGYTVATGSHVTVNGKNASVSVTYKVTVNYTDDYIIAGIVAAIVVIGLAAFVLTRKKNVAK